MKLHRMQCDAFLQIASNLAQLRVSESGDNNV